MIEIANPYNLGRSFVVKTESIRSDLDFELVLKAFRETMKSSWLDFPTQNFKFSALSSSNYIGIDVESYYACRVHIKKCDSLDSFHDFGCNRSVPVYTVSKLASIIHRKIKKNQRLLAQIMSDSAASESHVALFLKN